MTVGELRRLLVDLNIPDNANLYHVIADHVKTKVNSWFIEKSPSRDEYELTLVTFPPEKKVTPPPFKGY